jgi:transcriptional regulator with XRE-family HTH domain
MSAMPDDFFSDSLSELLKRRRTDLGLTQQQAADRIGVNVKDYGRWERGATLSPRVESWERIAAHLDVSLSVLERAIELQLARGHARRAEELASIPMGEANPNRDGQGVHARLEEVRAELGEVLKGLQDATTKTEDLLAGISGAN